ncbi:hypothetical protein JCM16303_001948 [Sporobolomyces ruberrimus]
MITQNGWSVQLYLASTLKMMPFDVQVIDTTTFGTYSAPAEALAVGREWVLVWRDERQKNEQVGTVVGVVSEVEGAARDAATNLVGTSISPTNSNTNLPNVRGIIRSSPPSYTTSRESPPTAFQHIGRQQQPSQLDQGHHRQHLNSQEYLLEEANSKTFQLEHALTQTQERAKYFEQAVSVLYQRLPPPEESAYLDERLMNDELAPPVRISVAIAKQEALKKLEAQSQENLGGEVERLIGNLMSRSGFESTEDNDIKAGADGNVSR